MANAYESYIRMLLWETSPDQNYDGDETDANQRPPIVTVVICSDNARALSGETSMTMQLLRPTVSSMDRWSSLPELTEVKAPSFTRKAKARRRSVDDLRSLMTNNHSKPTRSTENLIALGAGSIRRSPPTKTDVRNLPKQNDQWESKGPSRGSPAGTDSPSSIRQRQIKENPFDLQMPLRTASNDSMDSSRRLLGLPQAA